MKTYTAEDVRAKLRDAAGWKGAQKLARQIGVSQSYLSEVMNGKKAANETILASIGLQTAIIALREERACGDAKGVAKKMGGNEG